MSVPNNKRTGTEFFGGRREYTYIV